jgi:chorismate synthase
VNGFMSFRYLTAGESHGKALMGILEGVPAGLSLTQEDIQVQLRRRKLGYGRGARQKIETDEVQLVSGVRLGKTLGSPIGLWIENRDWASWKEVMCAEPRGLSDPIHGADARSRAREIWIPRPGHADWAGGVKYRHSDLRNVLERSSARETAMRVALGSVALVFLKALGIQIGSRVIEVGGVMDSSPLEIPIEQLNLQVDASPVRCLGVDAEAKMVQAIEGAKKQGNTLGGVFEVCASGVPVGLGSYSQWDRRLEAEIGRSFLSLNAVKGVEIGLGFQSAKLPGSEVHDEIFPGAGVGQILFRTNRSGGIDGGMSTGQRLVVRAAMKPLSTLMKPLASVNLRTGESTLAHIERSDVCAVPSAAVIGEALLGLVLAQMVLEKMGGDSMEEVIRRVQEWKSIGPVPYSSR